MNTIKNLVPPSSGNNIKPNQRNTNLFESFTDQAKSASIGVVSTGLDQIIGRYRQKTQDNENLQKFDFEAFLKLREEKIRNNERQLAESRQRQETLVYCRKEEVCKQQIDVIKHELSILVKQVGNFNTELYEAEKTVSTRVPDIKTGVYYMTFFERIRSLIVLAKKRITESRTWLGVFNQRCKARSYYWQQFSKSGTKFGLSQERTVATQAG